MSFSDVSFFLLWEHMFISAESHGFSLSDSWHLAAESRSYELLCTSCAASREHGSSPQAVAAQQGFDLFSGGVSAIPSQWSMGQLHLSYRCFRYIWDKLFLKWTNLFSWTIGLLGRMHSSRMIFVFMYSNFMSYKYLFILKQFFKGKDKIFKAGNTQITWGTSENYWCFKSKLLFCISRSLCYWRGKSAWSIEGNSALCCISGRSCFEIQISLFESQKPFWSDTFLNSNIFM